jgi:hypothetical protein
MKSRTGWATAALKKEHSFIANIGEGNFNVLNIKHFSSLRK